MTKVLPAYLYDRHIANLQRGARGIEVDWSPASSRVRGKAEISASLPTGIAPAEAAADNFFGGLLPEGPWLDRLANEVGVHHSDIFGLLDNVGGDLAGALTIGHTRDHRPPERLDPAQLPQLLEQASGYFIGGGGSALPGYQRKITLTRMNDEWWLGNGTLPSTHILKPSPDLNSRVTDSEAYLLTLSRALGLTTFDSWTENIGGLSVVVIERYDREQSMSDEPAKRLHQEDAAQALGLPWLSAAKFQRNDARANLAAIANLLDTERTIFDTSEPERIRLLRYVTFNLASGNTDAHAKNYSILRPDGSPARLAPLYDLMPLAVLSEGRLGLPMWINGKRMSNEVTVSDLMMEAGTWGVASAEAELAITDTLQRLAAAVRDIPAPRSIAALLPGFVRTQANALLDGKPARIEGPVPAYFRNRIGTPGGEVAAPTPSQP